jgi:hypothetical protein
VARCRYGVALGAFLCALIAPPLTAGAQVLDPWVAVSAYSQALNAHDVQQALALFDQYGSATDSSGRHFEGPDGLTEFLLNSGFGSPDARITTEALHVVGNRAVWTYSCSCASGPTEVRMVLNRDKISVFAVMAPRASPQPRQNAGALPWVAALVVLAGLSVGAATMWRNHRHRRELAPRHDQGHLMAGLRQWSGRL